MIVSIQNANYLGGYKINFLFSDGKNRTIDFEKFLENARNPMTRKYLNKELFQSYSIEYGDIIWNEHEMCFPIWNLHEGRI